jgi:hypothetical protein
MNLACHFKKILTRVKLEKKLSNLFINSVANKKKKEIILLEFSNWSFNHLGSSYVCDILSKKYQAAIESFPSYPLTTTELEQNIFQKFLWKLGSLLSLKTFGIYNSLGAKNIFWPEINDEMKKKAINEFKQYEKKIKSNNGLQNYKINDILIGDLIYDSYLKRTLCPTLDINSLKFKNFFLDSLKLFFFWDNFFKKKKISSIVLYHSVYLGALPLRFGISKKIPTYILNVYKLYRVRKSRMFSGKEYLDYKKIFNKFSVNEKTNNLKIAKKKILCRLSGILTSDILFANKSAYSNISNSKIFLKKSQKIKILIAPHSFCDSPHVFGNSFFADTYIWLKHLGKISNQTNYDWYIKCHPDFNRYFDNTSLIIKDFVKKYPNIKYLEPSTPHTKIIKEGIDYVLTVYGSIAGEYPFLGVNAINASRNHSQIEYDFCINTKNKNEYLDLIRNLKKPQKVNKQKQVLEHYYMKYEYFNNKWFFDDLNKVKKDIKGYNNFFREEIYNYWINNFDLVEHKKKYSKIKKFINSSDYLMVNK